MFVSGMQVFQRPTRPWPAQVVPAVALLDSLANLEGPSRPSSCRNAFRRLATPIHCRQDRSPQTLLTEDDLSPVGHQPRRNVALGGLALAGLLLLPPVPARAFHLHSQRSDKPCALTVQNNGLHTIKIFWINYDGDSEFYGAIPGGGSYTIDTFETHPWRLVDAASNSVIQELTATGRDQVVSVGAALPEILGEREANKPSQPVVASNPRLPTQHRPFDGFDGVGGTDQQYASAQLTEVVVDPTGSGIASLAVDGYGAPVSIYVGLAEAAAILYASGMELRRPSTISTWQHTIEAMGAEVQRVLVTRLVGHTYYARIVVALPGGGQQSVDARPSDSLALAMQCSAPVFVSKDVARLQQHEPELLRSTPKNSSGATLQLGPGNRPEPPSAAEAGLPA